MIAQDAHQPGPDHKQPGSACKNTHAAQKQTAGQQGVIFFSNMAFIIIPKRAGSSRGLG